MKQFLRELAILGAIATAASLTLGLVLGVIADESITRWLAYGLDIGGAIMIGLGFLTGPESPRKRYMRERMLKEAPAPRSESRLIPFVLVGLLLVGAGTLFELAL